MNQIRKFSRTLFFRSESFDTTSVGSIELDVSSADLDIHKDILDLLNEINKFDTDSYIYDFPR